MVLLFFGQHQTYILVNADCLSQKTDKDSECQKLLKILKENSPGLVVKIYGEIPEIWCYPGDINQVFMTLLRNAVQAIAGKGTVTIRTSADKTSVCVEISDSGKGIPPEQLKRIFDFSFTTKGRRIAMGMGLINAYNIIQMRGGEIKVESEAEKGSTFSVTLPIRLGKTPEPV